MFDEAQQMTQAPCERCLISGTARWDPGFRMMPGQAWPHASAEVYVEKPAGGDWLHN